MQQDEQWPPPFTVGVVQPSLERWTAFVKAQAQGLRLSKAALGKVRSRTFRKRSRLATPVPMEASAEPPRPTDPPRHRVC